MKQTTTLISAIFFLILVPSYTLAFCKIPQINKSFIKPFETEKIKWKIHNVKLYDNKKLGLNLKFESANTKIDFYAYDLEKDQITQDSLDKQLQSSVSEIIYIIKKLEPNTRHSLPLLLSRNLFSGKENLIQKGVIIIKKTQNTNSVSIVSMGFDGKCFQKLRYTQLVDSDPNFEQYFKNPSKHARVQEAIFGFVDFITLFHKELTDSGYFN